MIEVSRGYTMVLAALEVYAPTRVVVCASQAADSHEGALGFRQAAAGTYTLAPMPRSAFDDTSGATLISEVSMRAEDLPVPQTESGDLYLAYAAGGAVLQYAQQQSTMNFLAIPGSIFVETVTWKDFCFLSSETARGLELVRGLDSVCDGRGRGRGPARCDSLFDAVNSCKTRPGSRLLRASLLQPLQCLTTINRR